MNHLLPKVGIGIMIFKGKKILLGKRKGSHGAGEYSFPGGHLGYSESFEDCALREIAEECGIKVVNLRFQFLANVIAYAPKHYVHVGLIGDWKGGIPRVLEPDKCESWKWYDVDALPRPLFKMCQLAVDAHKSGKNYFDISEDI